MIRQKNPTEEHTPGTLIARMKARCKTGPKPQKIYKMRNEFKLLICIKLVGLIVRLCPIETKQGKLLIAFMYAYLEESVKPENQ